MNKVNLKLSNIQKEKTEMVAKLEQNEKTLKDSNYKISTLENELNQLEKEKKEAERKYKLTLNEVKKAQSQLNESQDEFTNDMISYEERIQELQAELIDKQNEIAITKAENGQANDLSEEERNILEREFEPRFSILYKDCKFYNEFYSDFFNITPSDRLKVEAAVVQLNYNYDQVISNVRPNPIKKTKYGTVYEYPFGTDSVGRIYFKKQNNLVHLYRLSRTKNGKGKLTQDNVIAWLKH